MIAPFFGNLSGVKYSNALKLAESTAATDKKRREPSTAYPVYQVKVLLPHHRLTIRLEQ
jgi:hypothetical protein